MDLTPGIATSTVRRLLLFTKPAVAGKVKTRLARHLGDRRATALHAAFLADVSAALAAGDFERWVFWAPVDDRPEPPPLAGWFPRWQHGADLGARLYRGFETALRPDPDTPRQRIHAAVVGSDHPGLDAATVDAAFDRLAGGADIALGPAEDGGYYLLAMTAQALDRRLFTDIAWSTDQVADTTLERCRDLDLRVAMLPTRRDVDEIDDFHALVARLATTDDRTCPSCRHLLGEWGLLS